jgi:tRNA 2-thiouridine synthesizing protein A
MTIESDTNGTVEPDRIVRRVDATGLACPMPVIELSRAIEEVEVGSVVELLATDPAAGVDVPVWCRMRRQKLHRREELDGVWHFEVERVS